MTTPNVVAETYPSDHPLRELVRRDLERPVTAAERRELEELFGNRAWAHELRVAALLTPARGEG